MQTIESQYEDPWDELPEVNDVVVSPAYCLIHDFGKISMPRDRIIGYNGPAFKCPIRNCFS